jgi:hypothetical protein
MPVPSATSSGLDTSARTAMPASTANPSASTHRQIAPNPPPRDAAIANPSASRPAPPARKPCSAWAERTVNSSGTGSGSGSSGPWSRAKKAGMSFASNSGIDRCCSAGATSSGSSAGSSIGCTWKPGVSNAGVPVPGVVVAGGWWSSGSEWLLREAWAVGDMAVTLLAGWR